MRRAASPPVFAVADPIEHGRTALFGLLHAHTSYSDGVGTPDDAFTMARAAGLDFFAITEHNDTSIPDDDGVTLTVELYEDLKRAAREHTESGAFIAIHGQEIGRLHAGNHINVFGASDICPVLHGDHDTLYERWLPAHPEVPFIQLNHPHHERDDPPNDYGIDDYGGDFGRLVAASRDHVALIELIVGPGSSTRTDQPHHDGDRRQEYLFYLNQGFRVGPSVGQDNHTATWGVSSHARLGVWANELTREALYEALASRRCYASEDDDIEVHFAVDGVPMGGVLEIERPRRVTLTLSIADPSEPLAGYRIRVFHDEAVGGATARIIATERVRGDQPGLAFEHDATAGSYYFVEIRQRSGHRDDVWTAPVWIDRVSDGRSG